MAVSGQRHRNNAGGAGGLYREDLAVSGQLTASSGTGQSSIIPRGFGGIRTTGWEADAGGGGIIPRGFGGIRTTRRCVQV